MSESRTAILERLQRHAIPEELSQNRLQPAFVNIAQDHTGLLKEKLEAVHTSVDIVESAEQLEKSIIDFLEESHCAPEVAVTPALELEQFSGSDTLNYFRCGNYADCHTVLTRAACGIAETGTVILASSTETPTLANFLPDNCIVLLDESDILPYLEDALDRVQHGEAGMPRALNLISGPSKTADIEQTLVYGAHGPIRLHVIIRRSDPVIS